MSTLCLYGTAASAQGTPAQPLQLETFVVGGPPPVEEMRAPTVRLGGALRAYTNLAPEPVGRARRFVGTGLAPGATLQPDQLVQNSSAGGVALVAIGSTLGVGGLLALVVSPFVGARFSVTSGFTLSSGSTAGLVVGVVMLVGGLGLVAGGAVSLRRVPSTGNNAATRTLYSRAVAPRVLPLLSLAGPDARPSLGLTLSF